MERGAGTSLISITPSHGRICGVCNAMQQRASLYFTTLQNICPLLCLSVIITRTNVRFQMEPKSRDHANDLEDKIRELEETAVVFSVDKL